MEHIINNTEIGTMIDSLYRSVGLKRPMATSVVDELDAMIRDKGDLQGACEVIVRQMGLPVKIVLSFSEDFQSTALVGTDGAGRGVGHIAAQVTIPSDLPMYGSSALTGFPIQVRAGGKCSEYPLSFVAVMAHEFSHILLHSLRHKDRDSEFHTDLCAMMMGFTPCIRRGRKVTENIYPQTKTVTYGYLSDKNFDYAEYRIKELCNRYIRLQRSLKSRAEEIETQIEAIRRGKALFDRLTEVLRTSSRRKIAAADGARLVAYHNIGHWDPLHALLARSEGYLSVCRQTLASTRYFTPKNEASLQEECSRSEPVVDSLNKALADIREDQKIVWRNIRLWTRLKLRCSGVKVYS